MEKKHGKAIQITRKAFEDNAKEIDLKNVRF